MGTGNFPVPFLFHVKRYGGRDVSADVALLMLIAAFALIVVVLSIIGGD